MAAAAEDVTSPSPSHLVTKPSAVNWLERVTAPYPTNYSRYSVPKRVISPAEEGASAGPGPVKPTHHAHFASLAAEPALIFKGEKDTYHVLSRIDRKMAAEILSQTGFEVPIKPGQGVVNHYVLASGAFGKFCVGFAETQKRYVGIKILRGVDAVSNEVALHRALNHRGLHHILPILDQHQRPGADAMLFQVMELAGLGSAFHLKNALNRIRESDFKEQVLFCLAEGLLQGLSEMHEAGFYHLDVKPNNMVVRQDGGVFLIDFGCSIHSETPFLNVAMMNGDKCYFSPERHLAHRHLASECDMRKIDAFAAGLSLLILGETQYSNQIVEQLGIELMRTVEGLLDMTDAKQAAEVLQQFAAKQLANIPFLNSPKPESFWSLVAGLLHPHAERRLSPKEALQHPWFLKMKAAAPLWREKVRAYLRELVQSQQREQRVLGPEDLPFAHFSSFVPRVELEAQFKQRLLKESCEHTAMTVCQGMGGVGKTQLVNFIVHEKEVAEHFGVRLWFRTADSTSALELQYLTLVQEWGLISEGDKPSVEEILHKAHQHLAKRAKPWLMVFDNAENFDSLRPFLPKSGGHVLVTTRNPDWENAIGVGVMNEREGLTLVKTLLQREEPEALSLCRTLGFLPLGIVQACAYIKAENLKVVDYISKLEQSAELLERDERSFGKKLPTSILGMWQIVFHTLQDKHPEAMHLLKALAYLAPDAIPQALLNQLGSPSAQSVLQRYALIQVHQGLGSLHRLLQLSVRATSQTAPGVLLSKVMKAVTKLYDYNPATLERRQANRLLHAHGGALCQHHGKLEAADDTVEAAYYDTLLWLGEVEGEQARFQKQRQHYEQALVLAERRHGPKHPDVATSLSSLGTAFLKLGNAKQAAKYHQRALAIDEKNYGPEHPNVALSLNYLGTAFRALGDAKKAAEYHQRALAIDEKIYGPEHPHVATSLSNLGEVFLALGDAKQAAEFFQRAFALYEKIYGPEHPHVATSLNNLGATFLALGDAKKAAESHQRALAIKEKIYGPEHPAVAASLSNLGAAFLKLGDAKQATEYFQRALALYEKVYGPEHPAVATCLSNLGLAFLKLGDAKQAAEYHQRALAIFEKSYGPEHPDVATNLNNLGLAFLKLGDAKQATEYLQRALAIRKKVYGPEHSDVAASLSNLGLAFLKLGDAKQAAEYLQYALALYKKLYGAEHQKVVKIQKTLDKCSVVAPGAGENFVPTPFTPLHDARAPVQQPAVGQQSVTNKSKNKSCVVS